MSDDIEIKTYREYVDEAIASLSLAWLRIPNRLMRLYRLALAGLVGCMEVFGLLIAPFFLPLVPLIAWLYKLNDISLNKQIARMRADRLRQYKPTKTESK